MSPKGKYRATKTRGAHSVQWFGFPITKTSAAAPILFFASILIIIGSLIGLIFVTIGLIQALSMMSAMQQYSTQYGTAETQAYTSMYSTTAILIYIVWIVILVIFLVIGIYTFNRMKQLRG